MVTYYRDMWPQCSHILSPLTKLLKTPTHFRRSPECDIAFRHMKSLVASETLRAYPDHNIPFHIETDTSDQQLGAVNKQNGHYTGPVNSADSTDFTGPDKTHSLVLNHAM